MVQLPTARDLGRVPSGRTGRIVANYDVSAAGRGLVDAGSAISSAATAIGKMGSSSRRGGASQAERFETNRRFLEFASAQREAYEDSKQSVEPGAFGFQERAQDSYMQAAREFYQTVPDALAPEYDQKLFVLEDDFLQKSRAFETAERTRYYGDEVGKGLTTIEADLFANPENFDQNYAQGVDYINSIPDEHLSKIQKDELVKQWRNKAQLASLNGVAPQERIRLLGGARNEVDAKPDPGRAQSITRGISGDVRKTISDAAQRYGVDPNALMTIAWLESRGKPNAQNENSSAGGLFQFIDSTAAAYGLQDKFDPAQAADAAARLARDNSVALEKVLGRRPTVGELYLAHQQGIGGAVRLLSNPNARAVDIVGSDAVRLNGGTSDMKAGEFAMLWMKKAGDTHVPDGGLMNAQFDPSQADPRFADMNYLEAQKTIQGAQAEIDASVAEAEKAAADAQASSKLLYDQHKGSLELAIETGELNSELSILNDPMLSDAHKADLIASFKKKNKERLETAGAMDAFEAGALSVDPYDSEGRKIVDNLFKEVAKDTPPTEIQATTEEIVRQTGVVPAPAVHAIRGGLASQNPAEVAAAAQSAQRLATVDPAALSRRDGGKEVQDAADDFAYYVNNLDLSPEDAARRLIEARDPQKKRDRKALEPAAKDFVKERQDDDLAGIFDESVLGLGFNPELGFTPAQEAGIKAEYLAIMEDEFYRSNGNAEIAQNRAAERMKRLYGVTDITGNAVVMKHPPERYWPLLRRHAGTSEKSLFYAQEQMLTDLRELDPGITLDRVQLVTTPETDAMVKRGEMPGYAVLYQDENGTYQSIPGKLWRPDMKKEEARINLQEGLEEMEETQRLERARSKQELSREKIRRNQELNLDEIQRRQILDEGQRETGRFLRGGVELPSPADVPEVIEEGAAEVDDILSTEPDVFGTP